MTTRDERGLRVGNDQEVALAQAARDGWAVVHGMTASTRGKEEASAFPNALLLLTAEAACVPSLPEARPLAPPSSA